MACFERIQKFLLDTSREDERHVRGDNLQDSRGFQMTHQQEVESAQLPLIDLTAAILIDKVTVRRPPGAKATLVNISMRLEASSMVAGRIGSGKSTLLKAAILGELPFEGNISVTCNKVAYCAQTP